jgi:hypothetical protein
MIAVAPDIKERIARNEATFRRINEDIGRGRDAEDDTTLVGFVCECGDAECARLIEMTPAEYQRVRERATRFAVVNGHEIPEVEIVVLRTHRFAVVEKQPPTDAIVREEDPRA